MMDKTKRLLSKSLLSLPFVGMLGTVSLAQNPAPLAVKKLHSFGLRVADLNRSVNFYQSVFGSIIQSRSEESVCLRIGQGPQHFRITQAKSEESLGITYIGLSVDGFSIASLKTQLDQWGLRELYSSEWPELTVNEIGLRYWETTKLVNGVAVPELFFWDQEGVAYQLQSSSDCGDGSVCLSQPSQPSAFRLAGISHFTTFLANQNRANGFYTRMFGKSFQAYQGIRSPIIGVGDGVQFLMYIGGEATGVPSSPGRIDHGCFTIDDFDVDSILNRLNSLGLTARIDAGETKPLQHWVSQRMPNRGGARGGTPEVYFSDPDGIRIQLQDLNYCGGGGYLGDSCPAL